MPSRPPCTIERFFDHHAKRIVPIGESGCLFWLGDHTRYYGLVKIRGEGKQAAHRVAYRACFGEIPEGHVVRHRCDVPCCINPHHLIAGTQVENVQDMVDRQRQSRGSQRPLAKLNEDAVRAIKSLLRDGLSQSEVADIFSVSQSKICRINTGKSWSHIE